MSAANVASNKAYVWSCRDIVVRSLCCVFLVSGSHKCCAGSDLICNSVLSKRSELWLYILAYGGPCDAENACNWRQSG